MWYLFSHKYVNTVPDEDQIFMNVLFVCPPLWIDTLSKLHTERKRLK